MVNVIAFIFAVILSISHYLSESVHLHKDKEKIISFGAGVLLSYLILDLLPRVFINLGYIKNVFFIFILLGFSAFHLIEKYIYQHASKQKRLAELKEVHSVAFFLYYVIIGIIMTSLLEKSFLDGLLFFGALLFHTTLGAFSLHEIHKTIKEKVSIKFLLSLSPFIGVFIATFFDVPHLVNTALLAFIAGALMFIITREVIPKENKGDPVNFLLGLITYTILIVSTWLL